MRSQVDPYEKHLATRSSALLQESRLPRNQAIASVNDVRVLLLVTLAHAQLHSCISQSIHELSACMLHGQQADGSSSGLAAALVIEQRARGNDPLLAGCCACSAVDAGGRRARARIWASSYHGVDLFNQQKCWLAAGSQTWVQVKRQMSLFGQMSRCSSLCTSHRQQAALRAARGQRHVGVEVLSVFQQQHAVGLYKWRWRGWLVKDAMYV